MAQEPRCEFCQSTHCRWRRQWWLANVETLPFPEPVEFAFEPGIECRLKNLIPQWSEAAPHLRWACATFLRRSQFAARRSQRLERNRIIDKVERAQFRKTSRAASQLLRQTHNQWPMGLSNALRDAGYDPLHVVATLEAVRDSADNIAKELNKRAGARPDPWRHVFHKTVAVILQKHGVTVTKSTAGTYLRTMDFLYEAVGREDGLSQKTLKAAIDPVRSGSWTWCDYEVGEVRQGQSIRLTHGRDIRGELPPQYLRLQQ